MAHDISAVDARNGWAADNRIQDCPSAYRSTELTTKSAFYPLPLFRQTEAFANNHWQGQAVDTARQLKLLLGG